MFQNLMHGVMYAKKQCNARENGKRNERLVAAVVVYLGY
jgi:hypothetical protein